MDTKRLTELMGTAWQDAEENPFPRIEAFLSLSHNDYQEVKCGKVLTSEAGWEWLHTTDAEEFGYNCSFANRVLKKLKRGEALTGNADAFPMIQHFLADIEFQTFCLSYLDELQRRNQSRVEEKQELPSPKKIREIESERESFEDIQKVYDDTKELRDEAQKYARAADKHLKAANELQKKTAQFRLEALHAKQAAESIIPNMLTTLGVFIAIVVAVVGCYLSLIFNKHQNPDFPVLNLSVCILMGHILLDVILLLMYLISKLTNYTMACRCHVSNRADCTVCPQDLRIKCRLRNRIWLRYPYVILLNGLFLFSYFILGLWTFFRTYLGAEIDQLLTSERLVLILAVIMVFLFLCAVLISATVMMPSKELLKAAGDQSGNSGLTEEQQELKWQVLDIAARMEIVEALYDGRKDSDGEVATPPRSFTPGKM